MKNTPNGSAPLYELGKVEKRYGDGATAVVAVRDVDLEIRAGRFVVISGPSGSGKSTLLQLLGGLDRASTGTVAFEGTDLGTLGDDRLAELRLNAFGFVFQQFNLIPTLTAIENVELALAPQRTTSSKRRQRARALLDQVGLSRRSDHLPSRLSGGEQQRVAIARALANAPRVVLADEPTGNLDTKTGDGIISLLAEVVQHEGRTVVLVTHDRDLALRSPVHLRMHDGRLEAA